MVTDFNLNDIVMMKKPHACQTNRWRIIRVGADVKIKCLGCERIVMIDRQTFEKSCKKLLSRAESENDKQ